MIRRASRLGPRFSLPASARLTALDRARLTIGLLALLGASDTLAAGTFYVQNTHPACSDAGPGTPDRPYCTISAAVSQRGEAGTTILVLPGRYPEEVVIDTSGAAAAPFVLRAEGGPVVVDGADDFSSPSLWVPSSPGVYLAAGVTWSPKQVFVDGARLAPSSADPGSLPVHTFRYVSSVGLYVNLGGDDPGARQTLVGRRAHGFRAFNRHWVVLDGFTVTRTENRAVDFAGGSADGIVRNAVIRHAYRYGIALSNVQRMLVERNVVTDNQDHGISLSQNSRFCTIQDNESARNVHPSIRQATGIRLDASALNLIQRNRLHHNQDSGEHLASGSDDNTSIQNLSWSNGDHGFDRLNSRNTLSIGDVAWGNHKDGFSNEGASSGGRMFNCIAVDNGLATGEFDLWVDAQSSVGFVSDHNIFWNSTAQAPIKFGTTIYATLSAYQAASGRDVRSLQADPRFVDPAAGDFHLRAGSPAIDAADASVPGWPANDAEGRGRVDDPATPDAGVGPISFGDRGALEFVTDQSPVVTAPASVAGGEGEALTVHVSAADPDGEPITSLTADLEGLPAETDVALVTSPGDPAGTQTPRSPGNDAVFTASPDRASGLLTWTPRPGDAGSHVVVFRAANALSASVATILTISAPVRPPVVTAPATASGRAGTPIVVTVTASDPQGEAIASLTADLTGLPAAADVVLAVNPGDPGGTLAWTPPPNDAVFLPSADRTRGTLTWTPAPANQGTYTVTFTATNARSGSAATRITVLAPGESTAARPAARATEPAPAAAIALAPAAGQARAGPPALDHGDPPLRGRLSPSPVRSEATLSFTTTLDGALAVDLFDLAGRRVRRLADESDARAGPRRIAIDGRDDQRVPLPAGIYHYRIRAREGVSVGRLAIVR